MKKRKWTLEETEDYIDQKLGAIEKAFSQAIEEICQRAGYEAADEFACEVAELVTNGHAAHRHYGRVTIEYFQNDAFIAEYCPRPIPQAVVDREKHLQKLSQEAAESVIAYARAHGKDRWLAENQPVSETEDPPPDRLN